MPGLYDENHCAVTGAVVGGGKLTLRSSSWVKPNPKAGEGEGEAKAEETDSCVLCWRTTIECGLPGIGGFVERLFEADVRAAQLNHVKLLLQERDAEAAAETTTEAEAGGRNGAEEVRAVLLADKLGELPLVQKPAKKKKAKSTWRFLRWSAVDRAKRREETIEVEISPIDHRTPRGGGWWRGCCGGPGAVREVREVRAVKTDEITVVE
jgi:hypothetical protein